MGKFDITQLLYPESKDSGEARPIGGLPSVQMVELTAILPNSGVDGGYAFGGQIEVELGELVMRSLDDSNSDLCIQRMEFKSPAGGGKVLPGTPLICSEHPYSSFWAASTHFKKGYKGEKLHFDSRESMLVALKHSPTDWWERDAKRLTAGIDEDQFRHFFQTRKRVAWKGRYWVFGVIPGAVGERAPSLQQVESQIFASNLIQGLIRKTLDGSIKVGRKGVQPRVFTRDEANALAWFSVRQALAGPHEDNQEWEGLPVVKLADWIYRDQLFNLSRRQIEQQSEQNLDIDKVGELGEEVSLLNQDILSVGGERFLALEEKIERKIAQGLPDWRDQVEA